MSDFGFAFNQATVTSSYKTAGLVTAAAAAASGVQIRRGKIFDLELGQLSAPNATDCPVQWDVSRQTAAGNATAVTPNPFDPADPAFMGLAGSNATAEGTITAGSSVLNIGINQRGSYRWACAPGDELVYPATASNGFAFRCLSPNYGGAAGGSCGHRE